MTEGNKLFFLSVSERGEYSPLLQRRRSRSASCGILIQRAQRVVDAVLYVWYKDPQAPSPSLRQDQYVSNRPRGGQQSVTWRRRDETEGVITLLARS